MNLIRIDTKIETRGYTVHVINYLDTRRAIVASYTIYQRHNDKKKLLRSISVDLNKKKPRGDWPEMKQAEDKRMITVEGWNDIIKEALGEADGIMTNYK